MLAEDVGVAQKRPAPKKPDWPLKGYVLSTSGEDRIEAEHLPREKKALEQEIVHRFLATLEEQQGIRLAIAESREDRADVVLRDAQGECIELQVTECVDDKRRRHGKAGFRGGRHFQPGEMSELLRAVVGKKLQYQRPASGRFWLLVYSLDLPVGGHALFARSSEDLLRSSAHPFDRVWLFGPAKNSIPGGDLVELFPNPPQLPEGLRDLEDGRRETVVWQPDDIKRSARIRRAKRGPESDKSGSDASGLG